MEAVLKRQMEEMTEDELREVLRRDYIRKLTRYKMIDDSYREKYNMGFNEFEKANVVSKQNYTFEVESDAQEWELAIDGLKTIERRLKE
ncbi:MAG: hypothetical protein ABIH71_06480 [Candidatus Omnitrophota bacterium]